MARYVPQVLLFEFFIQILEKTRNGLNISRSDIDRQWP